MGSRCAALALVLWGALAFARENGIATTSCEGCHVGGKPATVTLTASTNTPALGSTVRLTITIQAANGPTGGFYLRSSGPGTFSLVGGQPTRISDSAGDEVVHSALKTATGGSVVFLVDWNVPAAPGGVDLEVWAVSGNNADGSRGDGGGSARLNLVYGCAGNTYYRDFDGDGVGSSVSGVHRDCALLQGYSAMDGDCNDNDERVKPGNVEACNGRDDNCVNGVDEGFSPKSYYPDGDGDGYGTASGAPVVSCAPPAGYGETSTDCNDGDAKIHPGAMEICNDKDDDCDQRIDEGVRATCGVGLCIRASVSCTSNICTPGKPSAEVCNALDDDCDGVIDNGSQLCTNGGTCVNGICEGGRAPDGGKIPGADGGPGGTPPAPEGCDCQSGPGPLSVAALAVIAVLRARRVRRDPRKAG